MLLAPIVSAPSATAAINVALLSTTPRAADGTYAVSTTSITFGAEHRDGGFVTRSVHHPNGYVGINLRQVQGSANERVAAQAVQDAILGSGLLSTAQPTTWKGKPAEGMARLYFDKRSTFVEFPITSPTPAVQRVLDAMAAWSAVRSARVS